jgi:hypothetical protein
MLFGNRCIWNPALYQADKMLEEVYGNYSPILMMGRALEFKVSDSMKHEIWKNLYF